MGSVEGKKNTSLVLTSTNQLVDFNLKAQIDEHKSYHLSYLQVSVCSRHPPHLDSFQRAFLPHSDTDIFVPVGAVTLGLGRAMRTTGTT